MAHPERNRDTQQAVGPLQHPEEPETPPLVCVCVRVQLSTHTRIVEYSEAERKKLKQNVMSSFVLVFVPGKSPLWATDFRPYTTLMYGNGPGHKMINGSRPDIRKVDTSKALRSLRLGWYVPGCVLIFLLFWPHVGIEKLQTAITRKQFQNKWTDL